MKQQLIELIKTGDRTNIELALMQAKAQNIDLSDFIEYMGNITGFSIDNGWSFDPTCIKETLDLITIFFEEKFISISGQNLESIPDIISRLKKVAWLNIARNKLKCIPESIRQLSNLKDLDVTGNKITSIPNWLNDMPNLFYLHIEGNPIKKLPKWMEEDWKMVHLFNQIWFEKKH